jgi:hypothetical protein
MGHVNTRKRFFVRVRFEISRRGKKASDDYVTANREALMQLAIGMIELAIGRFPYAIKFTERDRHQLTRGMGGGAHPTLP